MVFFRVISIVIDDNGNAHIAHIDFQGLFLSNDGGYNYDNISSGMDIIFGQVFPCCLMVICCLLSITDLFSLAKRSAATNRFSRSSLLMWWLR